VIFFKERPVLFLILAAGLLFVFHFLSLPISPLPWFDETYFASMAKQFSENGEFMAPVGPLIDHYYPQSKAYGPAYFLVLSGMIKAFGFGISQIRFPALAFGFLFFGVSFQIMRKCGISVRLSVAVVFLLLFDPIFLQNIHSARMDSMALFFTGLGIYFLLNGLKSNALPQFILCGIAFGIAMLTTPRIAVCLTGPCIVLLWDFLKKQNLNSFFQGVVVLSFLVFLYSIWVFWGFGGFPEAYQYFFGRPREVLLAQNLAGNYIGGNLFIPAFQKPAICLTMILTFTGFFYSRVRSNPLFLICLINIPAFYFLVADTGIYSILNMPFVYLLMALCLNEISLPEKFSLHWTLLPLFLLNFGIFCFKNLIVWTFSNQRDSAVLLEEVKKQIPKDSKVIGDDCYYYAVKQSGSDFQYLERGSHTPMRWNYHSNIYQYSYIIGQDPSQNPPELLYYMKNSRLIPVGSIKMKPNSPFGNRLESLLKRFNFRIPQGYKGIIYKRI
jgi:hypothetical protein